MPTYRASTDVAAPPEAVHTLVTDVTRHPDWTADPLVVESLGDGRFRTTATSRGRELHADVHVVESVAPHRVVLAVDDPTGRWRHTFTITPVDDGCIVEREIRGELSLAQALLYWLVLLPIKKPSNEQSLEGLRRLAERG